MSLVKGSVISARIIKACAAAAGFEGFISGHSRVESPLAGAFVVDLQTTGRTEALARRIMP